jgi:hypothetical protein
MANCPSRFPHTVPHAEHIILYTTFFFRQRFGLDDILHVSHPSVQFCFTLGGAKTFDKGWPFIKCIFTFCMRDRFKTPKARRLNSSLMNGNFKNRWEICRRWPKNRGQKQSSLHLHSKQSRKLARSCFSWLFFAFHSTIYKLTVILLKVDYECFVLGWFVL